MRPLALFALCVLAWVALNLLFTAINFIGDNYSDTFGPVILLGSAAALAVWLFKKGN
jgi:hypothetical protein